MARPVLFVAVCALAAQSAFGLDINIPGLFGSSGSLGSLRPSNAAGIGVTIGDGALNSKVELGPFGGIQSRIVAPVLPSITEIAKIINDELQKNANQVGSFFSDVIDGGLGVVGLPKLDLWEKIVSAQTFIIDGIKTNVMGVIQQAGGLLDAAVNSALLTAKEASTAASAFMKSALESVVNPLAMVIDAVQWAVEANLMLDTKAIEFVATAVKQGLHTVEGASDVAANAFLDAAVGAQTITKDVADKLKEFIKDQANNIASGSANANVEAENKEEAGANLRAAADAGAEGVVKADAELAANDDVVAAPTGAAVNVAVTA